MRLPRFLRRTRHSRGQALVEFALILPLLALLLVMAIDFGRVFFGRIAIENAARIGADFAAGHAGSWEGTTPVNEALDNQALYRTQIAQDLQALNCDLAGDPSDPIEDRVPEPNFDTDGDGTESFDDGSLVRVTLVCDFGLITPLAETFFGGPVNLSAESEFPINGVIHTGLFGGAPPPPPPPGGCATPPEAAFSTNPAPTGGGRVNITSGTNVTFTDTSTTVPGCDVTSWEWSFGDGSPVNANEGPVIHVYVHGGGGAPTNYVAQLTVSNSGGSDTQTITVRVARP